MAQKVTVSGSVVDGSLNEPMPGASVVLLQPKDSAQAAGVSSDLEGKFKLHTACELTEGTGTDYCYTFCRGTVQLNNCYYLNAVGTVQGTQMTLEQFQNGEVCYKLNGNQSNIYWYQNIGEDKFPVLNESHGIVVRNEDGTYTGIKVL